MLKHILMLCSMLFVFTSFNADAKPVSIVTGPETGTYVAFGQNIADVAQRPPFKQKIKVINSTGSIDNIKKITDDGNDVALGIVQSDILGFLSRSTSKNTRDIAKRLSLIFPFYEEEVHILATKDIAGLRDLAGKRVIVGEEGSGNMLTAMNVLSLAEVQPSDILNTPPAEGVVKVLAGEADAMIFVGGKPVALFSNLADLKTANRGKNAHLLDNVHFVPIDDQRVFAEYSPTRINAGDYPFVDSTILTAKVNAVLVSYEPPAMTRAKREEYCAPLNKISGAIAANIERLEKDGHPKWKEVSLYDNVSQWQKNSCMWDGRKFLAAIEEKKAPKKPVLITNDPLSKDLLNVLKQGSDSGKKGGVR